MSLIIKLVFVSIAVCGVSSTNYLDYNGLSNVYGVAYAPHYNEYKPKDYKFEYGVSDPHTGDHKSQWEVKENGVVRGAYSLLEPDGTTRIVEYIADDDGFRAVVKKIGTSIHPTSPVIVHPAPLSHVTSLYDHSSGVYAGTKENYIAAYQPRPVLYHDDHGAENIVADGPLDDEVRIFFNNDGHDDLVLHGGIAKEHRPEFNYVAPNEYAHVAQAEVKTPQIISVAPKVYYEPQQQIVAQAPILGKVHAVHPQLIVPEEGIHQPQGNLYHQQQVQHQILHDAQQHQFVQDVPLQHQIVHEAPLQHQIVHEAPLQHQYANEAALQHQYVHQVPLEHRIVHKVPVHKQQVIHQEVIQGPAHQQQAAYEHYQPKVAYQNEAVYEQLAPIPYKTISAYAKQPHQDVGYEYHTNY